MAGLPHVPVLRAGREYASRRRRRLTDVRTGDPVAEVSLANGGLIARDLAGAATHRAALERMRAGELVALCAEASRRFRRERLPLDEETGQSFEDYLSHLAATAGLPLSLGQRNADKICGVLESMEQVLDGLTRGLDLAVVDAGWGEERGRTISYRRQTDALGAVLPNNSPGVHTLWLPAVPLKTPLALRPGSREPWTPLRLARAFMASGCPPEAFGFYPSGHDGAAEILMRCGRSLLFGGDDTVGPWRGDPRVEIHGAGRSKILIGPDVTDWRPHLDLVAASVADNGGRSCLNASGVWTTANGLDLAQALAERLARIEPRPLHDPEAALAAFPEPETARAISALIDRLLAAGGARDMTAELSGGDRLVEVDGCTFLRPTVVLCHDPSHPLANTEYLFPFAAVVDVADTDHMLEAIGPTLVATALTGDGGCLQRRLMDHPGIDRLNLGSVPTTAISWDQPHEGNLFEHLYRRRSLGPARRRA